MLYIFDQNYGTEISFFTFFFTALTAERVNSENLRESCTLHKWPHEVVEQSMYRVQSKITTVQNLLLKKL